MLEGRESEFPILGRAARDEFPSQHVIIEWLVGDAPGSISLLRNYQHIFREHLPRGDIDLEAEKQKALTRLLGHVEFQLMHGVPTRKEMYSTLGGYRHYLGRDLNDADYLRLRPLRGPLFMTWDDGEHHEWICETSLEVVPKEN